MRMTKHLKKSFVQAFKGSKALCAVQGFKGCAIQRFKAFGSASAFKGSRVPRFKGSTVQKHYVPFKKLQSVVPGYAADCESFPSCP